MNIVLTGATGTLGSNVLYKLLIRDDISNLYLLIRDKTDASAQKRLLNILSSKSAPEAIKNNVDLHLKKLDVFNTDDFFKPEKYLANKQNVFFIHSAGFVNLSTNPAHKETIFNENFNFTKRIFNSFSSYLHKFIYISTAYSIGDIGGLISNDYHNLTAPIKHRNYYEASKHAAESYLLQKTKQLGMPLQILRPSVLGGNISDAPQYFISKYMVYYLLAKFFYNNPLKGDTVRIAINAATGLNIIPVDYAAAIIDKVFTTEIAALNITHSQATNLASGIKRIMEAVGFEKLEVVNGATTIIGDYKSKLEAFYYNSIGIHLGPYLTSLPYEFDTTLLESIIPMPTYNLEDYLEKTVVYAKERSFRNKRW